MINTMKQNTDTHTRTPSAGQTEMKQKYSRVVIATSTLRGMCHESGAYIHGVCVCVFTLRRTILTCTLDCVHAH